LRNLPHAAQLFDAAARIGGDAAARIGGMGALGV
jgi:hypothetical protein